MRTNFDEMASNVSDGVVKLTEKDVSEQRLCIALSRITVCSTYNGGWSVEELKGRNEIAFHDYLA